MPVRLGAACFALVSLLLASGPASAGIPFHRDPARLGIEVQPMTPELRRFFRAPEGAGVLVARVEPDSPAEKAGVKVGDVILEAGGEEIESPGDLLRKALPAPEGEELKLVLLRDGAKLELGIVPRGFPHPPLWDRDELWGPQQQELLRELREQIHRLEKRLEELEHQLEGKGSDRT